MTTFPTNDLLLGTGELAVNDLLLRAPSVLRDGAVAGVSVSVASSSESSADATLVERIVLGVIGSSSEDWSGLTLAERLVLTVAASTETSSDATLAERLIAAISTATEDYSDATLTLTAPPIILSIASTTETGSDALGVVTNPIFTAPGGGPGARRRKRPEVQQYQIAAHADPQRPYATALEPVTAWTPESDTEDEEMIALLAFFHE